jgi:hypothetical protein
MKKKSLLAVLKDHFSGTAEEEKTDDKQVVTPPDSVKPNVWGASGRTAQMRNGVMMQQRIRVFRGNSLD